MSIIIRGTNKILKKFGLNVVKHNTYDGNKDYLRLKTSPKPKEIKLHFGCGPRVLKGWINIDLIYEPYENYLQYYTDEHYPENIRGTKDDFFEVNILKHGLPLPDESVDIVFHEDFFEHLTQKEQIIFLAETWRVLKKGSVHRINTPNLVASMRDNSDFSKGFHGVFKQEWDMWHHYSIMTPKILKDMAEIVGYSHISFNSKNGSSISHRLPLEYRPDPKDRPSLDSNVFADLTK